MRKKPQKTSYLEEKDWEVLTLIRRLRRTDETSTVGLYVGNPTDPHIIDGHKWTN